MSYFCKVILNILPKNTYILKLLLNVLSAGIEELFVWENTFLYACAKEVCCL
jgi:hypothetical protein